MRLLLLTLLLVLLGALQYRLWFGQFSIKEYFKQQEILKSHELKNLEKAKTNQILRADVDDLQKGLDSIEERARNELGLVKQDETFFRLVMPQGKK